MRVLLVHNKYQQRGGEDAVVDAEADMLRRLQVEVRVFWADNDHIRGIPSKVKAAGTALYNPRATSELGAAIAEFEPHIVHVHNWFPTLSPAIFQRCKRSGSAVIHTLHNYRLLCIKASLYRNGVPCEECLGKALRLPGIAHACYRGSRLGSAAATAAMVAHWQLGTWRNYIDKYIALSEFAKTKLCSGGLPEHKVAVKPNSLSRDPGIRSGGGGYMVYAGRLTDEKGIAVVLNCWKDHEDLPPLRIAGSGPLEPKVKAAAAVMSNVEWIGPRTSEEVLDIIGNATAVLCPSLWYEGMPRVVIEAMAVGTPVIASRLGSYVEMIDCGKSGMLFDAGSGESLRGCVREFSRRGDYLQMRAAARRKFEVDYHPDMNARLLLGIYHDVLVNHSVPNRRMEVEHAA